MPRSKVVRMERLTTHVSDRMLSPVMLLTERSLERSGKRISVSHLPWKKHGALNPYISKLFAIKI